MQECDLIKAIEKAAFAYLSGLLINRIGKLLGKRVLTALAVLVGSALADGPLLIGDVIGLVVALGIGIWSIYDTVQLIKEISEKFRNGIWQQFKKLPKELLAAATLDCLNRKPHCCELFQREAGKLLLAWVKGLRPGWKKGNILAGSVAWRRMLRDIKTKIAGPLAECCT